MSLTEVQLNCLDRLTHLLTDGETDIKQLLPQISQILVRGDFSLLGCMDGTDTNLAPSFVAVLKRVGNFSAFKSILGYYQERLNHFQALVDCLLPGIAEDCATYHTDGAIYR